MSEMYGRCHFSKKSLIGSLPSASPTGGGRQLLIDGAQNTGIQMGMTGKPSASLADRM